MKQDLFDLLNAYPQYAILVSIGINVVIAILGIVPSVFITAANVLFFGFWPGTIVSFAGETIGAFIAFLLYRAGLKKSVSKKIMQYPKVQNLLEAKGRKAFYAIVSLRLLPFVPSGIITFAAAVGAVDALTFFVASSLGKIPALLIEAYAAYEVTAFTWQGKVILVLVAVYFLYLLFKKKNHAAGK